MFIKLLSIFILIGFLAKAKCEIDLEHYFKMPNMHRQHDYERCLWSNKHKLATYCTISTLVKPDPSNEIWNQIEEFSSHPKINFAHDILLSGQCLSQCEKSLSGLTEKELEDLYVEKFPHSKKFTYDITAYKNGTLYRKMYDKIFNQCENLWLRENWNLSGYSTILWCTTNQEFDHYETDYLHTVFLVVTFLIMGIVIAGTGLDMWQNNENSLNYYKVDRFDLPQKQQCLLCFSVVRNWYRLVAPPKTELGKDLRFLLTVRYLTALMVVMGHIWMSYGCTPAVNPEFVENAHHTATNLISIFRNCGTTIVQTFFLASGALLYISFSEVLKEGQLNLKYFGIAVIYRYIRVTPVYAYLILYHSTYFFLSASAPYWKFYAETEYSYCRRNAWTNLLYINNYVDANQPCMFIGWYLAADTHLFLFALFLFMIMWRFPKYKKLTLALAFLLSCVIQFLVTHLNGFDPMFLIYPEDKQFGADIVKKDYLADYIASHTNAGNYLIGICAAMIYFHFKKNNINFNYKSFQVLWHILPVIAFPLFTTLGYTMFHTDFELPSISLSFLSVFIRQMWGFLGIVLALGFFSSFRSPVKNFFNWPVFTPLSRLTYCIYLCHTTVGRLLLTTEIQIASFSEWLFLRQSLSLFALSNFVALILCLCLEFPLTGLTKILLRKERIQLPTKDEHKNNGSEETEM